MPDLVECLSSPSYPGEPVALTWQGVRRRVEAILDRWRSPQAVNFRVRTTDEQVFELGYDFVADVWRVVPLSPSPSPLPKGEEIA